MEKIKSNLMTNRDSLEEINRECKIDLEEKAVIKNLMIQLFSKL